MKNSAVMAALKDDITAKREAVLEAARTVRQNQLLRAEGHEPR